MTITVDLMHPTGARASRISDEFSVVHIQDESNSGAAVTVYIRDPMHEQAAHQIADLINVWCRPNNSLSGTCEKLLAEEEKRRKAEPYAIDERFMEKVE